MIEAKSYNNCVVERFRALQRRWTAAAVSDGGVLRRVGVDLLRIIIIIIGDASDDDDFFRVVTPWSFFSSSSGPCCDLLFVTVTAGS